MQSHPRAKKRQDERLRIFSKGFRSLVRPLFRDAGFIAAKLLTRSAWHFPLFFDFPFVGRHAETR